MRNWVVIFFLSITIGAYAQNNGITVKLISYRVLIKPFNEAISDQYKNYGLDLSGSPLYDSIKNNMGQQLSSQFAIDIYNAAINGKLKVYDPFLIEIMGAEVKFTTVLTPKEVEASVNWVDSGRIQRPYPPYEEIDTVFRKVFNPENIVAIEFLETWSIDEKTMEIKKKIIAFAPLAADYGFNQNYIDLLKLFWVKM